MQIVLIDSAPFDSYASLAQADAYLFAAFHAGTTWSDAADNTKGQALVTATRVLDRQKWSDAYDTQAEREGVADIQTASMEMALALIEGSDLQSEETTGQKLQSITAGSVSLIYFRGAEGRPHRFPNIVWELLRDYLVGAGTSIGMVATGTGGISSTEDEFGHTGGL